MDSEEVMKLIKSRRSVREYKQDKIPKSIVDKILEAGTWAPSAMNKQPWKFVVVSDSEVIKELSERVKKIALKDEKIMSIPRFKDRFESDEDLVFYNAPLLIFVAGRKDSKWIPLDTGLAAQNMFLYAYSQGIGSCWIGFAHKLNQDRKALNKLSIPEDHEIVGAFVFGYPKTGFPEKSREEPDILARFE